MSRGFARFAARRGVACATVALLVLAARLAMLPWVPVPVPSVHDEFSYLLAGDTFRSGRLANPPHPLWPFLETFHVIQQPTYSSKYPPMQGLTLAAGRLMGHPWIGVLLTTATMCGVLCWSLQGWLPPGMALLGALLAGLRIGLGSYWMNSYWGGGAAALGGAMVVGALPRLLRKPQAGTWWILLAGSAILLNSRPFEGLLLIGLCGLVLIRPWLRNRKLRQAALWPVLVVTGCTASWMLYYNYRVTGNSLLLPYIVHEKQYAVGASFSFAGPHPAPVYRHDAMRRYWTERDFAVWETSHQHPIVSWLFYLHLVVEFYLGGVALTLVLAPLLVRRTRRLKLAGLLTIGFLVLLMSEKEIFPHYAAPFTALIVLVATAGLIQWWRWNRIGRVVAVAIACFWLAQAVIQRLRPDADDYRHAGFATEKDQVTRELENRTGAQLVFVRYAPSHYVHYEWVYNRADIDASRVVWARDMGDAANRQLLDYFPRREAWRLEPDEHPRRLVPYPH